MTWQEAIEKSCKNEAKRKTKDGRWVYRTSDRCVIQAFGGRLYKNAGPNIYEGFNDWEPCK